MNMQKSPGARHAARTQINGTANFNNLKPKRKRLETQASIAYAHAVAALEFRRAGAWHPPQWAGFVDRHPRTAPRRADGNWRHST